jgi:hypothetical protein
MKDLREVKHNESTTIKVVDMERELPQGHIGALAFNAQGERIATAYGHTEDEAIAKVQKVLEEDGGATLAEILGMGQDDGITPEVAAAANNMPEVEVVEVEHYEPETGNTWIEKVTLKDEPVKAEEAASYETIYDALTERQFYAEFKWEEGDDATPLQYARWFAAQEYNLEAARERGGEKAVAEAKRQREQVVSELLAKIAAAEQYHAEGYRLNSTERSMIGVSIDVPELALYWRTVHAGHIATSAAFRISYLYKTADSSRSALEEVMTPAEIEREYNLPAGTVRQAIRRGNFKLYRRADERTYLIRRIDAERQWKK